VKPDLDRLLRSLRNSTSDHPRLPELERLLWQRLSNFEPPLIWRRLDFHLGVTAVLGALVWGILIGTQIVSGPATMQTGALFIEPQEFLTPSTDDLPF
jgi:hypothetical protein